MRRTFHGYFKIDIKVSEDVGVMLLSSFDAIEAEDVLIEAIVTRQPD